MVDFNSEGLFTANKGQIIELVVLGRRDELINTMQLWRESKLGNTSREEGLKSQLRSVLFALFLELERPLSRTIKSNDFDALKLVCTGVEDVSDADLLKAFFDLNATLDVLGLIKIDKTKRFDNLEDINKSKGFD